MHQLDAGDVAQQLRAQMRSTTRAAGTVTDKTRLGLGQRDQFLHVVHAKRRMRGINKGLGRHLCDGREVFFRVIRQLGVQRGRIGKAKAAQPHGVAIRVCLGHEVRAHNATTAAAVVDHHRLPQVFGEIKADQPADDVRAATGCEGNDQTDRFVGIVGGVLCECGWSQCNRHTQRNQSAEHG